MIKRDGVKLMNARTNNVSIAKETLAILKQKYYNSPNGNKINISEALDAAVKGSVLYQNEISFVENESVKLPLIEVTPETTAQAAQRLLCIHKDVVVLNFASARNPGGGFLSGAIAQEEDLCRCSGLYSCLKSKPIFYNENILCDNTYYTDNIIYSPNVPFFRSEHFLFLENPFCVSVITAPAPNIRGMNNIDEKQLFDVLSNRISKILKIAAYHNHKNIILGAFGCGAFGNDPLMVAHIFLNSLKMFNYFGNVCFAIYSNKGDLTNLNAFKKIFDK